MPASEVAVVNAMGRVFMNQLDSPFTKLDELLDGAAEPLPPIRILDFHCEITSEKNAMGWYLDGRVSAVVGHAYPRARPPTRASCRRARPTSATSA